MRIAIIKYNAGNIRSVSNAMQRLGAEAEITDDFDPIRSADKVIFPGVGEASTTMAHLRATGMDRLIVSLRQPVLGVCLGIFDVPVRQFALPAPNPDNLKVPQMGWNTLTDTRSALFDASIEGQYVYFVHGFYVPLCADTIATTDYILPYSSALHRDNFYATQFHPEKSGAVGERILRNFIEL